ncbi:hypothetical protein CC86DRAFT_426047 [Ophiobolus disseminans]|uniref:Uncharacterized protein n=1 Tax=Ophiobolus disseminans TaxID=1469910 RepID=A0A6A6ZM00_9PLEO|nr:hypothetical protein CC86DRAFT_426047 [Ophiobolus disseminans]
MYRAHQARTNSGILSRGGGLQGQGTSSRSNTGSGSHSNTFLAGILNHPHGDPSTPAAPRAAAQTGIGALRIGGSESQERGRGMEPPSTQAPAARQPSRSGSGRMNISDMLSGPPPETRHPTAEGGRGSGRDHSTCRMWETGQNVPCEPRCQADTTHSRDPTTQAPAARHPSGSGSGYMNIGQSPRPATALGPTQGHYFDSAHRTASPSGMATQGAQGNVSNVRGRQAAQHDSQNPRGSSQPPDWQMLDQRGLMPPNNPSTTAHAQQPPPPPPTGTIPHMQSFLTSALQSSYKAAPQSPAASHPASSYYAPKKTSASARPPTHPASADPYHNTIKTTSAPARPPVPPPGAADPMGKWCCECLRKDRPEQRHQTHGGPSCINLPMDANG